MWLRPQTISVLTSARAALRAVDTRKPSVSARLTPRLSTILGVGQKGILVQSHNDQNRLFKHRQR